MPPAYIEYVTTDKIIHSGPCILYAARPRVATDAQVISLYNGLDTLSGILIDYFTPDAGAETPGQYGPGVFLDRGLYVDIGTAGDGITVVWEPAGNLNVG